MPYTPTWNNPYLSSPYMPQLPTQTVQPYQQPVNGVVKVNGRDSAMQYQLPPNSMSPALFDNNGKVFYIVHDHIKAKMYPPEGKTELRASVGGSDFLDAVNGKPYEDVLKVVDEHLETIRLLYPKTYDSVLARIRELC